MFSLDQICGVIDFDGFYMEGNFYTREAGFASLYEEGFCMSQAFTLPESLLEDPSEKDRRAMIYNTRHIHGLCFRPRVVVPYIKPYSYLQTFVRLCVDNSARPGGRNVLAYKGGSFERSLLQEMGLPSVNLEEFGCPKFDVLIEQAPDAGDIFAYTSCVEHKPLNRKFHCPRMEVFVFRRWIRSKLEKLEPVLI